MARPKKYKSLIAIYVLCINTENKIYKYIGQTINLTSRLSTHKRDLKKNKHHNKFLQRVWNKYENLDVKIFYCEKEELTKLEQFYIDNLNNVVNTDPANATDLLALYATAGPDNQCASTKIYKFYNTNTKEIVEDTVYNLALRINPKNNAKNERARLSNLINGKSKSYLGWCLYKNKDKVRSTNSKVKLYKFRNIETGEIVEMKRSEFCKKYKVQNSSISEVLNPNLNRRKRTQFNGWTIHSPL